MSTGKKAGIIVGCIVAAVVVVLIATRPSFLPSLRPLGPKVSVDYEVIAPYGHADLSVRVQGPENAYEVVLFNPDEVKVGVAYIFSDDMIPGYATVRVSMTGSSANAIPGEYWLIVKQVYPGDHVFEARPVFQGPDLAITNVQFRTYRDHYWAGPNAGDPYAGVEATVQVYNSGDLPISPDFIKLSVAGDERQCSTVFDNLLLGETTTVECQFDFHGLGEGTYPATVEIYSDGVNLASYATQVTIQ